MIKKSGNFFEEHIEKLILAIVGLICIWLLLSRVLVSPNVVSYDNKKFTPYDIDSHIKKQSELLEDQLDAKPTKRQKYQRRFDEFAALVDSAISNVDSSVYPPQPNHLSKDVRGDRRYNVPRIGQVSDVSVEHIRAVAYVPVEMVDEERTYEDVEHEANDIDFTTVAAKFDIAQLLKNCHTSFAGDDVQQDWRDSRLAEPVFAAVHLQRKELGADGAWSDWQTVPRTKIDHRREMFEIIEEVSKLPAGGIEVRLLKFNSSQVREELLQPEAYMIASASEQWFPPALHRKYLKYQEEIKQEDDREAREAKEAERQQERGRARSERQRRSRESETRGRRRSERAPGGGLGMLGGDAGVMLPGAAGRNLRDRRRSRDRERSKPTAKPEPKSKSIDDIYKELDEILLTEEIDFSKMDEPLVFWAHDDTIEAGKEYRYRIRLGVFNPIAGTNQFVEQDKPFKNKVILWSDFSDETEAIAIPGSLYFFPLEVLEATDTVTVQVSRYVLGYWYSQRFMVRKGEVIGRIVDYEPQEKEQQDNVTLPEAIDYSTGAVLIDVIDVRDWSGPKKLKERYYSDMLYSPDGTSTERIAMKTRNWPKGLQAKFNEIRRLEKEPKEPLRDWGSKGPDRRKRLPQRPGQIPTMPGFPGMPGIPRPGY